MKSKTTLFENGLIWFGAGLSIAEIVTGTYFAPLGFRKAVAAIIIGHVVGCGILFLSGIIGGRKGLSAMESVKESFGIRGGQFFAILNVLQLVGWTAIMIYDGALAADGIFEIKHWLWCLIIGGLIILWIIIGITNIGKLNLLAMAALFVLTIIFSKVIFADASFVSKAGGDVMSFGAALELAIAMPLSWLPLISDYTSKAEKPKKAAAVSSIVYCLISCWMYIIGMGISAFTGEEDIALVMIKSGLGAAGLIIVVLSTVTTTFLDAYSAGISGETIFSKFNGKNMAVAAATAGTILAIVFPMDDITGFLYFIGSVFAPMIAIQIADSFILHKNNYGSLFDLSNMIIWAIGFIIYRILMNFDIFFGNTLPDMAVTLILCVAADKLLLKKIK